MILGVIGLAYFSELSRDYRDAIMRWVCVLHCLCVAFLFFLSAP